MKKLIIGLLVFALVLVIFPAVVYADVFTGTDYSVDVQNDDNYLYIDFEATGGDYTIPSSMTNIYVLATGECWAYCAKHDGVEELYYSGGGLIRVERPTSAKVEVDTLTMKWKIPLSETSIVPGDEIAFHFMSFSEGSSSWGTAWLYDQDYTLSVITKADILKDSGIPGKGLENAPGLQKPFNPNSQADEHAGMK